jgi:O-methyltransferase
MKKIAKKIFNKAGYSINKVNQYNKQMEDVWMRFKDYTMIKEDIYKENLRIALQLPASLKGDIAECGVWRGGMSAGIAALLGKKRKYYLFDSFEGLPPAKNIDGAAAIAWQQDTSSKEYYNNCKAEIEFAQKAMELTGCEFEAIKGWFADTLPRFSTDGEIALLRLDGDWYESTMDCLVNLFPKVADGGYVVIDDYFSWDGCAKAVHDFLSEQKTASRIYTSMGGVCYIIKKKGS